MRKLYKYQECFRGGTLSGVFTAEADDVDRLMNSTVYLGEVLGKHSEVVAKINDKTITLLDAPNGFVEFVDSHMQGGVGTDPINAALSEEYESEEYESEEYNEEK